MLTGGNLKNPTLSRDTYLYRPYLGLSPPPPPGAVSACKCLERHGWLTVPHIEKFSLHHQFFFFFIFLFTAM